MSEHKGKLRVGARQIAETLFGDDSPTNVRRLRHWVLAV